jgi:hypothetical protein
MTTVWVLIFIISGLHDPSVTVVDNIATYTQCAELAHRIDEASSRRIETLCFSVQKVKQ